MQQKYVIRDRCVLLLTLLIFSIGTYSLFANTNNNFFEVTTYQNQVKGVVTDSNGIPIPGVTVKIKDTSTGTFTNDEGIFHINASPTDVLILTYIGFKTLEVSVGNSTELSLVLQEDVTNLGEVTVNAGYYTVKDRERTGSISKVTAEEIELQPIVSPLEALQGRMAGVEIQQQSGVPGNAPVITIRGRNSLREDGNYPLYIIDGMPINSAPIPTENLFINDWDPLSTLNLSNIESIEVLKDADATAIYGSRGANGVVLITTKKGTRYNQETEIQARWFSGFAQVGRKMKILDTDQYMSMRRAALSNSDFEATEQNAWDLLLWDTNRYTDWPEELLGGISSITNFNISASGGNENTSFRIDGSYNKRGTVFPLDNHYQKFTTALNLQHTSENKRLGINLSINYGTDLSESSMVRNLIAKAYLLSPNAPPLYNKDGSLHWEEWEYSRVDDNPLAEQDKITIGRINNLLANLRLSYKLSKGLNFVTNFGYTVTTRESKRSEPNTIVPPWEREETDHRAAQQFQKRLSWIVEPQFNYHVAIGKGKVDVLAGSTFQKNVSDGLGIRGIGLVSESLINYLPAAEQHYYSGDGRLIEYKYHALYGRLGYNWNKKYFINLTGRRDGSSRFGTNNRFTNFWAIGAAWILSEESFITKNLPFISFAKLRSSYGITGNDQIGDYQYLDAFEATPGPNGLYPTRLYNANFAWEENHKLEAAIEFGLLNDRINLATSWYRNRSSNQLVGYPLPRVTGFTSVQANLPATVQNTGWEIEFSSININSKGFKWQTSFNVSFPKNKLLKFPNIEQTSYANMYQVGHPLNISMRYKYNGINPETGLHEVVDINEDGRYDYQDRIVIKATGKQYFGGLTNQLFYKGFRVSILWDFVKKETHKPFMFFDQNPGYQFNRPIEEFKAWEKGELYLETSIEALRAYDRYLQTDHGIVDASFIRLSNLTVSYDLPIPILKRIGINHCRVFGTAQNLITFTSYPWINLELSSASLPALQTITTGIQLQF